jgi:hypothetical protein
MKVEGKSTRMRERMKPDLPLHVRYREAVGHEWEEDTRVSELTQHGAGFTLSRPVEAGRLIHLAFPMPHNLRAFDYDSRLYNVWAVIRNIRMLQPTSSVRIRISVGTAFIGKDPRASFLEDPTTRYDLKPTLTKTGLWSAREAPRHAGRFARPVEPRLGVRVSVTVETISERGELNGRDEAETLNVSERGAAVLTELTSECGRFVRLTSSDQQSAVLAVVRGHNVNIGGGSVLHLEFVSGKWPLLVK